mmetsp:Transcript_105905/g.210527  ORF Transcript_105905/g.210527 Transcript_105905/m.210527 type:complete len:117 (+) Transcript_105905:196-546(+)
MLHLWGGVLVLSAVGSQQRAREACCSKELQQHDKAKGCVLAPQIHGFPEHVRDGHGNKNVAALDLVSRRIDHAGSSEGGVDDPLCSGVDTAGEDEACEERWPEGALRAIGKKNGDD